MNEDTECAVLYRTLSFFHSTDSFNKVKLDLIFNV